MNMAKEKHWKLRQHTEKQWKENHEKFNSKRGKSFNLKIEKEEKSWRCCSSRLKEEEEGGFPSAAIKLFTFVHTMRKTKWSTTGRKTLVRGEKSSSSISNFPFFNTLCHPRIIVVVSACRLGRENSSRESGANVDNGERERGKQRNEQKREEKKAIKFSIRIFSAELVKIRKQIKKTHLGRTAEDMFKFLPFHPPTFLLSSTANREEEILAGLQSFNFKHLDWIRHGRSGLVFPYPVPGAWTCEIK